MSFSSSAVMTDIRKEQGWGQGSLRHVPVHGGGDANQVGWDLQRDA